jgi:N-acetylneuraminate synthase
MLPDDDAIDEAVSSTPNQLRDIVEAIEHVRTALGSGVKECQQPEAANVIASRRGLYATRTLRAGERVAHEDVLALRPATSLPPSEIDSLIGVTLRRDVAVGTPFELDDVRQGRAA